MTDKKTVAISAANHAALVKVAASHSAVTGKRMTLDGALTEILEQHFGPTALTEAEKDLLG